MSYSLNILVELSVELTMGLKERHLIASLLFSLITLLFPGRINVLCAAQAAASSGSAGNSTGKVCGPPAYCARTDRKVEPYTKTPPALGRPGSIITDPAFGSRIVRVTDEGDDPQRRGRSLMTPASAEQNAWNTTSTNFYVVTAGGSFQLYDFAPSTLAVRMRTSLELGWRTEPQFSFSNPNLLFGTTSGRPELQQYDLSTGKVSTVDDPARCLKLNSADAAFDVSVSADDNRFMAVIGPRQNENYLVYIYDRNQG